MFMFAKYNFVEIERGNKKAQILDTRSGLILPSDIGENTHNKAVPQLILYFLLTISFPQGI